MAASSLNCGVCDLRHIFKPSAVWCTECDEGLCEGCQEHHVLSKASRNHTVIPISEYKNLPSDVIQISQFCDRHNAKYSIYCKKHDCPCCSNCIVESHNKCQEIAKLDDVINNVKTSNAFYEIEQKLDEVVENMEKIKKNRQNNLQTLSDARKQIEKKIQDTRTAINKHIDKIQADIIKSLQIIDDTESKKIRQMLNSLEGKQQEIAKLQGNIFDIKEHASDLQTFLSMKRLENEVSGQDKYLRSISGDENLKQVLFSFDLNTAILNIADIQNFGKVVVGSKPNEMNLITKKQKQAQMMVTHVPSRYCENLNLKLKQTIDADLSNVCGLCLLPDGRMAFSNYVESTVKVLNVNGSLNFEVKSSSMAFDIAHITDDNILAVTSGDFVDRLLTIIDLKTEQIKKTIPLKHFAYGITYNGSKLVDICGTGFQIINLNDESIIDFVQRYQDLPGYGYIAAYGEKLFYTNSGNNTVTCCDLHSHIHWTFCKESILKKPAGISVDNNGNVYVVGHRSNNVIIISFDGQQHRQLLTKNDGLSRPRAIHFSMERRMLLVANYTGKAFLYSVD